MGLIQDMLFLEGGPESFSIRMEYPGIAREIARALKEKDELAIATLAVRVRRLYSEKYPLQSAGDAVTADAVGSSPAAKPTKRRASSGSAQEKIRAALLLHHRYKNGSCGNWEPIGTNALAKLASVGAGSVTTFWQKQFTDAANYERQCANDDLIEALKLLAGDVPPSILSGERRNG